MQAAPTGLQFPLDEEYLPRLHLDNYTLDTWKGAAEAEIRRVLTNKASWYYRPQEMEAAYKLVFNEQGLRGYSRKIDGTIQRELYAHGALEVTLDDISYGLHCETTLEMRAVQAHVYAENFLDAAVLHVAEAQNPQDPFNFSGVKWIAQASLTPALVSSRDYMYYERSMTTKDADGRTVLVQYIKSVALRPDQVEAHDVGLLRSTTYRVSIFRLDADGSRVLYQSIGRYDPGGSIPSWLVSRRAALSFQSVLHYIGLADARAVMNTGLLKRARATSKAALDTSTRCYICQKKFNMMRKRQNCRACTQAICPHCAVNLKFFNTASQRTPSSGRVLREKFCLRCVLYAREQRGSSMCMSGYSSVEPTPTSQDPKQKPKLSMEKHRGWRSTRVALVAGSPRTGVVSGFHSLDLDDNRPRSQSDTSSIVFRNDHPTEAPAPLAVLVPPSVVPVTKTADNTPAATPRAAAAPRAATTPTGGVVLIASAASTPMSSPDKLAARIQHARFTPLDKLALPKYNAAAADAAEDVFTNMNRSLAAQEALLQTMQHEAAMLSSRTPVQEVRNWRNESFELEPIPDDLRPSIIPDDERFEILS